MATLTDIYQNPPKPLYGTNMPVVPTDPTNPLYGTNMPTIQPDNPMTADGRYINTPMNPSAPDISATPTAAVSSPAPYILGGNIVTQNPGVPFTAEQLAQRRAFINATAGERGDSSSRPGVGAFPVLSQGNVTTPQSHQINPSAINQDNFTLQGLLGVIGGGLGAAALGGGAAAGVGGGAEEVGAGFPLASEAGGGVGTGVGTGAGSAGATGAGDAAAAGGPGLTAGQTAGGVAAVSPALTDSLNSSGAGGGESAYSDSGTESGGAGGSGAGSALSRVLDGTATTADYISLLGSAAGTGVGIAGSINQQRALQDLAKQQMAMGAPYRDRLAALYNDPSKFLQSAEVTTPVQQGTDALARSLSVQGNPIGSGHALQELQNYSANQLFSRLGQEKDRLGGLGGLTAYNNAAPGTALAGVNAGSNVWNAAGSGLASLTNPQPNLVDIYKMMQGLA